MILSASPAPAPDPAMARMAVFALCEAERRRRPPEGILGGPAPTPEPPQAAPARAPRPARVRPAPRARERRSRPRVRAVAAARDGPDSGDPDGSAAGQLALRLLERDCFEAALRAHPGDRRMVRRLAAVDQEIAALSEVP